MQAVDCCALQQHLYSCRMTVAIRLSDCNAAHLNAAGSQPIASPLNWTIARLMATFPSNADAIPIAPSRPTIATSVIAPVASVTTTDTTAFKRSRLVMKSPASYSNVLLQMSGSKMKSQGRCVARRKRSENSVGGKSCAPVLDGSNYRHPIILAGNDAM
jgi:hypothetical protein